MVGILRMQNADYGTSKSVQDTLPSHHAHWGVARRVINYRYDTSDRSKSKGGRRNLQRDIRISFSVQM